MTKTFKLAYVAPNLRSILLKLPALAILDVRQILDLLLKRLLNIPYTLKHVVSRSSISSSEHAKIQVYFSSKRAPSTPYKCFSPLIPIVIFSASPNPRSRTRSTLTSIPSPLSKNACASKQTPQPISTNATLERRRTSRNWRGLLKGTVGLLQGIGNCKTRGWADGMSFQTPRFGRSRESEDQ